MANGSARILLVDDEQSIQTLLSYPLRKDGYEVVQATDGRQALDRFDGRSEPFTWLYRIAVNLSLNTIRSRKTRKKRGSRNMSLTWTVRSSAL